MDPSLPQQPQTDRRDADSGRVAMPEIAELLHLQRPAAAVAAAAVVLLALLVTLVAPSVLAANIVTGLVVGVLALLAAAATAVLLDGRDPVLRGPRHLRRDGHTVLARMAGPDPAEHGGPVLAAIERRLEGREHLGIVLTGTGADPSELAVTLGRAAAANGHTALVIDLRAPGAPGVADVGEGTVRLGEAARLADDRPYAWIGAGVDREAAGRAAAGVANRPPRDLKLLLVVAPDAATHVPEVLGACDRTVLLVAADTQQRAMVTARLNALERAGGRPEAVVVGGLRVLADDDTGALDIGTAPVVAPEPPIMPRTPATAAAPTAPPTPAAAAAPTAPPTPAPTAVPAVDPAHEPAEQEVPAEPAEPELPVASEPEPEPEPDMAEGLERTGPMSLAPPSTVPEPPQSDEPEPTTPPAPEPDPVQVPDPEAIASDATDDLAAAPQSVDEPHDVETPANSDPGSPPPVFRTASPARPERSPFAPAPAEPAEAARAEAARAEAARAEAAPAATEPTAPARPASEPAAVDHSSSVAAPVGDTSIEGMAEPDLLLTVAALEQLVSERRQRGAG